MGILVQLYDFNAILDFGTFFFFIGMAPRPMPGGGGAPGTPGGGGGGMAAGGGGGGGPERHRNSTG